MTLLDEVTARLDADGVSHALIGAAALAAAGIARSTFDVDLLATDGRCLLDATWDLLRSAGAAVEVRRGRERSTGGRRADHFCGQAAGRP